jgi:hypothetical protein
MAKDYKTLMKERRARQGGGVPQVDPDEVVLAKLGDAKAQPSALAEPTSLAPPKVAEEADDRIKVSTFMYKTRHKQVKREAADTGLKEWQIIEQGLDLYFKTNYPPKEITPSK